LAAIRCRTLLAQHALPRQRWDRARGATLALKATQLSNRSVERRARPLCLRHLLDQSLTVPIHGCRSPPFLVYLLDE
jgi:hypothetical protein